MIRFSLALLAAALVAAPAFAQQHLPSPGKPDSRVRAYVTPTRVVWSTEGVTGADNLLNAAAGQITLANPKTCAMKNTGKAPGILLDFGKELQGGLQIGVSDNNAKSDHGKTVRLRVRFGESVSEAMSELGEKNSQTDHAVRDQTVFAPWLGTVEVGNSGFRFARIDLIDPETTVNLKFVRAIFLYRDLPYIGSFKCSDERLNKIWQVGAYTTHLNMQDYLWDGIKRDRLVWIGDMHPETSTIAAVFGNVDIVPQSLDLIRGETPVPGWMNGISSYSLWWILIQRDWYMQTGDLKYLQQQSTYLKSLLTEVSKHVGAGNEETLPEGRFLDWPSSENKPAIHAGLHALMILALEAGSELSTTLADKPTAALCNTTVARLRKHVPGPNGSKQAAALMALAGLKDAATINREVIDVDGVQRMSTFYGFYVLEARAKAGDYAGAMKSIKDYWGAMLDLGATTFWEDFNIDWIKNASRIDELVPAGKVDIHGDYGAYCYIGFRHSLCHGWASGPTPWLSKHVLGIQVLEPGCKKVRIAPHLGDLKWVEGTYPTPMGPIWVRHTVEADGSVKSEVRAPKGIKIVK